MQKGATHVVLLLTIVKLRNILKKFIKMARVIRGFAPEPLICHYEEKTSRAECEAACRKDRLSAGDKSAGSESRLRRGAVTEQSIK